MSIPLSWVELPAPQDLKKVLNTLAITDVIMHSSEKAWLRQYVIVDRGESPNQVFHYDTGSGDSLFVIFFEYGCLMKGFDHESEFSPHSRPDFSIWPGIYNEVPPSMLTELKDPMYEFEEVTFCVWWEDLTPGWTIGEITHPSIDEDGLSYLTGCLYGTAEEYVDWAQDYFERDIPREVVEHLYSGAAPTPDHIVGLNPDRDPHQALTELSELLLLT
ncbi:MAG: hypothetical protein FWG15_05050 [Propionibacteriaceae bacterium]|nr:hypothetical protein [Propionibacteriaceae bacterium]